VIRPISVENLALPAPVSALSAELLARFTASSGKEINVTVSQQQQAADLAPAEEKILEGEESYNTGNTGNAIRLFEEALAIDPHNPTAHSNLGVVYWQQGNRDKAIQHLNAAYRADPENSTVILNLTEVYAVTGQTDEIRRICSAYLDKHPEATDIRGIMDKLPSVAESGGSPSDDVLVEQLLERGEALHARGETHSGLAVLNAALTLSQNILFDYRANCIMGAIYRDAGQTAKAIQHLMDAFRFDSRDKATALDLARLFQETQHHDIAQHVLATFLYLHPDDPQARELMQITEKALKHREQPAAEAEGSCDSVEQEESPVSLVERIPEMNDTLNALLKLGVEMNSILDVGVLHGTPALMQNFPTLKHYLFEPIDDHFDTINSNYARLDHELHHVALSNTDGEAWQNGICNNASGNITHSHISDEPLSREQEPRLIVSKPVRKAKLDSMVPALGAAAPYLLKIDVDGHEIPILQGAVETLKNASVVVIEATRGTLLDRAQLLADNGFLLFDIVDFAYYAGVLHQVDLVFVRKDIFEANAELRPMETRPFAPQQWHPLSYRCFGK
jgi:FkbM family methyltransferase